MSKLAKALTAAAGNAGGDNLYVEDVFSTYLYEGNSSTQTITNGIDLDGEGGLVWLKTRSSTTTHALFDTERGVSNKLSSDTTGAATTSFTGVSAFNSDGFSLGSIYNTSPVTYASWTFRKAEKFFDVVTYTGDGVAGRTVAHNLGSTPAVMIFKRTDASSGNWPVYVSSLGATALLRLNITNASFTSSDYFNDTVPTDSSFTVGDSSNINASGGTYVAYLFASDAGGFGDDGSENIIKCGSFSGDSNADIALGFEPQFLIYKRTDTTGNWGIFDVMRGMTVDGNGTYLLANTSGAEATVSEQPSPIANGFRWNSTAAGSNYIYIAIRRPMKTPESGTEVFDFISRTGTGSAVSVSSPILTDALLSIRPSTLNAKYFFDRPRGGPNYLATTSSSAEGSSSNAITEFGNDYIKLGGGLGATNGNGSNYLYYLFQRATGFFDVVAYTGTSSARTIPHNLGVVPEFMIVKNRDSNDNWICYHSGNTAAPATEVIKLNETDGTSDYDAAWNDTAPTSSVFTVGHYSATNNTGQSLIAYLFATLDGVSKVGSYTGTGSNVDVDCGFSAGARFILIKRSDSTGDWYVYDSERGIVAGNDPYLLLNSEAAEVTSTDYIDPLSSGFTVTSSAPAALNASGGNYIFLAIA